MTRATRARARIPTAAEVKKAAARLTGRADDETEDNAASPFDTAEIPVPHSREYERAEDAPAIRALLAKKRARGRHCLHRVGCDVSCHDRAGTAAGAPRRP